MRVRSSLSSPERCIVALELRYLLTTILFRYVFCGRNLLFCCCSSSSSASITLDMIELEGREFEERMINDPDPYVGTKLSVGADFNVVEENVNDTWNSMTKLFENRNNQERRCKND